MSAITTKNHIQLVVAELLKRDLFAVIVPTADPHNSEYVAPCFQRRAKLCGFSGSAGTCIVTADSAALLWTDGRYWLEAEKTLDAGWKLMKAGDANTPSIEEFLEIAAQESKSTTKKIGIDPSTQLWSGWRILAGAGLEVVPTEGNIVDAVLNENGAPSSPPVVKDSVILLGTEDFAGTSFQDKISAVVDELKKMKSDLTLLTSLDEVAWLLNLRAPSCCDIPMCPTFFAFAVVSVDGRCHLFIDQEKLHQSAKQSLQDSGLVSFHPYRDGLETFFADRAFFKNNNFNIAVISESTASYAAYHLLANVAGLRVKGGVKAGIVERLKGIKTPFELASFKECHIRDGVALTRFLAWLDHRMTNFGGLDEEGKKITEVSAAAKLLTFRQQVDGFVGPSFETIAGAGANGAIIHHRPDESNPAEIKPQDMFLVDSGGQYIAKNATGTTDVTRTVVFDRVCSPPPHWKRAYTFVLKGHIRINSTVFPAGTTGHAIDALARLDLWKNAVTFRHGTGHGVGFALNVHEGPHGIGMVPRPSDVRGLQPGAIISNEPGFYIPNEFGIRIENLDVVVSSSCNEEAQKRGRENLLCRMEKPESMLLPSCRLESITIAPLCAALIDKAELSQDEVQWVNDYHEKVLKLLVPRIEADANFTNEDERKITLEFLKKQCEKI